MFLKKFTTKQSSHPRFSAFENLIENMAQWGHNGEKEFTSVECAQSYNEGQIPHTLLSRHIITENCMTDCCLSVEIRFFLALFVV